MHVIGCDVGTQSTKAILIDERGATVARATRPHTLSQPAPGWVEQDPREWLAAVGGTIADVVSTAGLKRGDVGAIGIAAQVDGIVAVDRANRPLGPAPIWMDRRATAETAAAGERMDPAAVRAISGANLDPSHGAPKIAWLREHLDEEPDAYLMPAPFIVASLTGRRTIDPTNASSLLLLDVAAGSWSAALLDAFGVDETQLGDLLPSTAIAGGLSAVLASEWGLDAGCPVAVGTGDEHAAFVAAGVLRPGLIGDVAGTAEPVAAASEMPVRDPAGLVETHAHVPPGRWLIEHPGFVSAGSVRWLAEVLGVAQPEIGQLAAGVPAGAGGVRFLAALGGAMTPRWSPDLHAAFAGLALSHDRRHLARAVLEGCAYAVRDIVDRLDQLGLGGPTIRVVGGGARDRTWLQIKADVTGRRLEVLCEPEATALGAALTAAVGIGWFADLDAAAAATLRLDPVALEPDPAVADRYAEGWAAHRALFEALEPLDASIPASPASVPPGSSAAAPAG